MAKGAASDALRAAFEEHLDQTKEHVSRLEQIDPEQAQIHATLGDTAAGCAALARAVTDHSLLVNWMRLEPRLDPLRGSQCFADAERKLYAAQ